MGNVHVVGPNEALVISGGCCGSSSKRFVIGGWAWTCYLVNDIQKITLEVFTLNPKCEKIESQQGVPVSVTAIAQCKIDKAHVSTAAEMFLGKNIEYIKSVVLQTIEGHLRAITGTLTMERIYSERQVFASTVSEMVSKDLENLGISLLSLTIKEISDQVEYLESLGRKEIAITKHNAAIKVALAEKDSKIEESKANHLIKEAELKVNTEYEEQNRDLKINKLQNSCSENEKMKIAQIAYQLQEAKVRKEIMKEEQKVNLLAKQKQILILNEQMKKKKMQLYFDYVLTAEAEAYRITETAKAKALKTKIIAEAEAKKIEKIATAKAKVIEETGSLEATLMKNRAAAFKLYNDVAVLQLTLATLPKFAAEICAPLRKIDEIVLMNGTENNAISPAGANFTAEAAKLASELPPTIKALTGISLSKAFENLMCAPANGGAQMAPESLSKFRQIAAAKSNSNFASNVAVVQTMSSNSPSLTSVKNTNSMSKFSRDSKASVSLANNSIANLAGSLENVTVHSKLSKLSLNNKANSVFNLSTGGK